MTYTPSLTEHPITVWPWSVTFRPQNQCTLSDCNADLFYLTLAHVAGQWHKQWREARTMIWYDTTTGRRRNDDDDDWPWSAALWSLRNTVPTSVTRSGLRWSMPSAMQSNATRHSAMYMWAKYLTHTYTHTHVWQTDRQTSTHANRHSAMYMWAKYLQHWWTDWGPKSGYFGDGFPIQSLN